MFEALAEDIMYIMDTLQGHLSDVNNNLVTCFIVLFTEWFTIVSMCLRFMDD